MESNSDSFRITLAAPPADFLKGLYGFHGGRTYRNQPPLGIGYLASSLREAHFSVTLLDCAAFGWDMGQSVKKILQSKPDVVGITAITYEAPAAYELVRQIKRQSDAFVVLGGAHTNSFYSQIHDECPELDAIAAGESEATFVELCDRVHRNISLDGIKGFRCKEPDGNFSELIESSPVMDLDTLAPPAFDLYPHHLYRPLPHRAKRLPSSCMITSRGCSYQKCTYCELSGLIRKVYRRHSPERVIREMKMLVQQSSAKDIYFQDDIFITEPEWVEEFCDRLEKSGLDIIWSCESRFLGVTATMLSRMKKAGCWRIYYGFESGNQHLLDKIKKGFTLSEAKKAAQDANQAGLDVVGFFMLGLPGETPQDARRTIKFSLDLNLDHAVYALTIPHPNTELYKICETEGTMIEEDKYFYKKAAFVPKAYRNAEQLENYRAEAFRRFYLRPAYWWRCLTRIRSVEDIRYYLRGFLALFGYLD